MKTSIIICDLDGTLVPFESTNLVTKNNKGSLKNSHKYYNLLNLFLLASDLIRSSIGFQVRNNIFFKNEKTADIQKTVTNQFQKTTVKFNNEVLDTIKNYERIVFLTGSHTIIATEVIGNLPDVVLSKSEIMATENEIVNDKYSGKVLTHVYGINKRKILTTKFAKLEFDGIGNSIFDIPFLLLCRKKYLYNPSRFLFVITNLFYKNKFHYLACKY